MRIASGLHRVGSQIVNSYLIAGHDGVTIIDAGLPGYWKLLQAELAVMGKSLGDVRALILTHGDTDHIGFAARLHRETGVAAHIHEADADRARLKVKKPNSGWGPVKVGPLAGFLWYSARRGGLRPSLPPSCGPSPTATCSTCPARRGSSILPGTHRAASQCTSRPWTRCSSATR